MNKTPDIIVKIEKSGNRFNAWDTDGIKRTSEITTGARRRAFEGDYLLGRFTNKSGNYYWSKVADLETVSAPAVETASVGVDIPTDHAEVVSFIHNSYNLKPYNLDGLGPIILNPIIWMD